uniref:Uncharacterized protein n=1 Tax=Rhizophora mucronata TaxID=61149 RepID=A0A2P2PA11_RHIMU
MVVVASNRNVSSVKSMREFPYLSIGNCLTHHVGEYVKTDKKRKGERGSPYL